MNLPEQGATPPDKVAANAGHDGEPRPAQTRSAATEVEPLLAQPAAAASSPAPGPPAPGPPAPGLPAEKRSLWARISGWFSASSISAPFVAVHAIDQLPAEPSVKKSDFPALQHAHVVEGKQSLNLISFWSSEDDFYNQAQKFSQRLELGDNSLHAVGSAAVVPSVSRWERMRAWGWRHKFGIFVLVAALVSFLGDVDDLIDWTARHVTPAAVGVTSGQGELRVGMGQRFATGFQLRNESSLASSYLHVTKAEILDEHGNPTRDGLTLADFAGQTFPLVSPGGAESLELVGVAKTPGLYTLKISGYTRRTKTLFSEGRADFTAVRKIRVWPPLGLETAALEIAPDGKLAKIPFTLRAGKEYKRGVVCTADVTRVPNLSLNVVAPGVAVGKPSLPNSTPGKEAISISWVAPSLAPFNEIRGHLILHTSNNISLKPEHWQEIATHVTFNRPVERVPLENEP